MKKHNDTRTCLNDISYTDLYGNPAVLTKDETRWFDEVCDDCRAATGITVPVCCANHEKLTGKEKDALGSIHTNVPEAPLTGDTWITIDNFFIHESYATRFCGSSTIETEELEHVIAHEMAHLFQWRHCKRHSRLTEEFYEKIMKHIEAKNQ